jgi:cytochrome c oxidase subunit 3
LRRRSCSSSPGSGPTSTPRCSPPTFTRRRATRCSAAARPTWRPAPFPAPGRRLPRPLLNTLILLTSGTTVTWAHHALLEGDRKGLRWGLILTIALGAIFTCVQAYEYAHAAFTFSGHIYGSTFFMATGFHGAHVLIGTAFLIVCLIRSELGHFTPQQHLGFEFAAWYWHFVDVVWIFLFVCIYVWGAGPMAGMAAH